MAVAISGDIHDCICEEISLRSFERKEYNEYVKQLRNEINELESANENLRAEIKRLRKCTKL